MKTFWIGVCLAIGLLVVILATQVAPQAARAADLKKDVRFLARQLEGAVPGTPSRQDIAGWKRYRADLDEAARQVTAFYAERDRHFERWFPGLTSGPNGAPSRDAFVTRFRDEGRALEEALRRVWVKVGPIDDDGAPGFNWEELTIQVLNDIGRADEAAVLHAAQKRFWARQRIADLALQEKVRISRIVDFRFFERLHDRAGERPRRSGNEKVSWPGLSRDFQESPLPAGLGRTFTFGAVLQLPAGEVPRAIRELLNPGRDLLTLVGAHVTIGEPLTPIAIPYEKGKEEEFERLFREARKAHPSRDVLLTLSCRILDLDLK